MNLLFLLSVSVLCCGCFVSFAIVHMHVYFVECSIDYDGKNLFRLRKQPKN